MWATLNRIALFYEDNPKFAAISRVYESTLRKWDDANILDNSNIASVLLIYA